VVICLERGADFRMAQLMSLPLTVSCFSKIQIGFTFFVPAHLGSPGKRAVKRVCVCVCSDDSEVLYNKFNVDGSSPSNNPPPHPNTDYSCVVATTDHWEVVRCDDQHRVVCQSDYDTLPGTV